MMSCPSVLRLFSVAAPSSELEWFFFSPQDPSRGDANPPGFIRCHGSLWVANKQPHRVIRPTAWADETFQRLAEMFPLVEWESSLDVRHNVVHLSRSMTEDN